MRQVKKIYGPYNRKDGRQHVIAIYTDGSRRTISYPKYLMEQHLGRELDPDEETIDHIDNNFTNNDFDNLRIISRSQHISEDNKRARLVKITCVWCGKKAMKKASTLHKNSKGGYAGPFCSKHCSGQYGAAVQNNRIKPFPVQPRYPIEERKYYTTKNRLRLRLIPHPRCLKKRYKLSYLLSSA